MMDKEFLRSISIIGLDRISDRCDVFMEEIDPHGWGCDLHIFLCMNAHKLVHQSLVILAFWFR